MTALMVAIVVGMFFATGSYLLLRRHPVKLLLGLGLMSYGVNLLLFSTGSLVRGLPPIIEDKKSFAGDISGFVDPLPQALILTAIVISFGVTAFVVMLVFQRNRLAASAAANGQTEPVVGDPFAATGHYLSEADDDPEDYVWLEYSLADEYRRTHPRHADESATP